MCLHNCETQGNIFKGYDTCMWKVDTALPNNKHSPYMKCSPHYNYSFTGKVRSTNYLDAGIVRSTN